MFPQHVPTVGLRPVLLCACALAAAALPAAPAAHAEECAQVRSLNDLDRYVATAKRSFVSDDLPTLVAAVSDAEEAVRCMDRALGPTDVANVHIIEALRVWNDDAPEAALPYLQAARDLRGDEAPLDIAGVPSDAALAKAWDGLAVASSSERALPPTRRGRLYIDGRQAEGRPSEDPFLLQCVSNGNQILASAYVLPGGELPRYPRLRPTLAATGLGTGLVAGGLALGAMAVHSQATSIPAQCPLADGTPCPDGEALLRSNHALAVGSITVGAASLSLLSALTFTYIRF